MDSNNNLVNLNVRYGRSQYYDEGVEPSISINDNFLVVEAHKSQSYDELWYRVGRGSIYGIEFSAPTTRYDDGVTPSISINNSGVIVEVHKSQNKDTLWYHVGIVDEQNQTIDLGPSIYYDDGVEPSISINDSNQVIEVHKSQNEDTLWCRVGVIDPNAKTISFQGSFNYDAGILPSVSLNNSGQIVEVHQSQNYDELWCHIGQLQNGSNPVFTESVRYDTGVCPSISINNNGSVVEVHKSENYDTLYSRSGYISADINTISFRQAICFDTGKAPVVTSNNELSIQSHCSETYDRLWYSQSLIVDYSSWMSHRENGKLQLGDSLLSELTLPGSHDAGTYFLSDTAIDDKISVDALKKYLPSDIFNFVNRNTNIKKIINSCAHDWGEAQSESILEQLNNGVRYFDLRPCFNDGAFYIHHGLRGPNFNDVFNDINTFLEASNNELVIIKLSHFDTFSPDNHKDFITLFESKLIDFVIKKDTHPNPLMSKFDSIVNNSSKILVLYSDDNTVNNSQYCYPISLFYDSYTNTPVLDAMAKDQKEKLENTSNHDNQMFILSWLLTPSDELIKQDLITRVANSFDVNGSDWINIFRLTDNVVKQWFHDHNGGEEGSLKKLSQQAAPFLTDFIKENSTSNKINVVYCDYYSQCSSVNLSIKLNFPTGLSIRSIE